MLHGAFARIRDMHWEGVDDELCASVLLIYSYASIPPKEWPSKWNFVSLRDAISFSRSSTESFMEYLFIEIEL
jgi:hypothetical protein